MSRQPKSFEVPIFFINNSAMTLYDVSLIKAKFRNGYAQN